MNLPTALLFFFIFSYILNYIYFNSKKTAIDIVNDMGLGYNLGNVLAFNCCSNFEELKIENEQIKIYGTIFPTKHNINKIKKYGFKTIRFQVIYMNITNDNDKLNSEWISKIKEVIKFIINENMYCILSIRHDGEFWKIEGKNGKDKYVNLWKQIANELINYDEHLIFESNNDVNYDIDYFFDEDDINIEDSDDYISYGNDYPSDINRDEDDNYDEDDDYIDKNYHIPLLNTTQSFIDTIRNTGGLNKERLLIISGMHNEIELMNMFEYEMPKDTANKSAISFHSYIPLDYSYDYIYGSSEDIPMDWYDNKNNYQQSFLKKEWGTIKDYQNIISNFNLLKELFTDKGIPVIITEVGMMSELTKEKNFMREFLYVLFSITEEYNGIMSCLWDISEKIGDDIYYYNKEKNQWKDQKIIDNLNKISRLKYVKISEFYIETNLITEIEPVGELIQINLERREPIKVLLNIKLMGVLEINTSIFFSCFDSKDNWIELILEKKHGKKQYDGTTYFIIDISSFDCQNFIEVSIFFGKEFIIINNLTVEFKESFIDLDYKSYKSAVLKEINN